MGRIFNMDNPFFSFMGKLGDIILLNFICIICCLPIITIGAAMTAMYYTTLKIVRNEESYIVSGFFKSFRQNFKQATIIHLITCLLTVILYVDYIFFLSISKGDASTPILKIVLCIFMATCILLYFTYCYVYPVLSKFYNTTIGTLRNAFLMAIRHLPKTILIAVINLLPIGILFIPDPKIQFFLMPFIILFGFSGIAAINSRIFVKIFDLYIETEENNAPLE